MSGESQGSSKDDNDEFAIIYRNGYSVTNANNNGEEDFDNFNELVNSFPRLKGLENIFQPITTDPKEKAEYEIEIKYNVKGIQSNGHLKSLPIRLI